MLRVGLYWRTGQHLTLRQLIYQVVHRLRGQPRLTGWPLGHARVSGPITFTFLNQCVTFGETINWNYAANGKLWTYQLNYFEYLNGPELMLAEQGLALIQDFIRQTHTLRDGLEPYPTSLRIQNWIQFLRRNQIQDSTINAHLFGQTQLLHSRLEYHLGGNHLLDNGFALLTAALYFQNRQWFRKAAQLVCSELDRQILPDGCHDERSPAYHQAILSRLNSLLETLRADTWHTDPQLIEFVAEKVARMQSWLAAVTFRNGDLPMLNDCIAVAGSEQPQRPVPAKSAASGYRMFRRARYELFADAGAVGPDCQPGHGHADTLSFLLYIDDKPLLVDAGTSTYELGKRRQWERSTAAHNTVEVAGQSSSEVWASFRIGRRARVSLMTDSETALIARHDGYRHLGLVHERSWMPEPATIHITDNLIYQPQTKKLPAVARFYVHPDWSVQVSEFSVAVGPARFLFTSTKPIAVNVAGYQMADGFNQYRPGQCIEVSFATDLKTIILLT